MYIVRANTCGVLIWDSQFDKYILVDLWTGQRREYARRDSATKYFRRNFGTTGVCVSGNHRYLTHREAFEIIP